MGRPDFFYFLATWCFQVALPAGQRRRYSPRVDYFSGRLSLRGSCVLTKRSLICGVATIWLLTVANLVGGAQAEEVRAAKLSLKGDLVYGMLGPVRSATYFPGEEIRYALSIAGLKENEAGYVAYGLSAKLQSEEGESLFELPPYEGTRQRAFGQSSLTLSCALLLPADTVLSKAKILITVRDLHNEQVQAIEVPIEIVRPEGAYLVSPQYTTYMNGASPASGHFVVGDHAALRFGVLGLEKLPVDHQYTCRLLFVESGKAVGSAKSMSIPAKSLTTSAIHGHFHFPMDREFDGVARLELTNDLNDRKCVVELPLRVSAPLKLR